MDFPNAAKRRKCHTGLWCQWRSKEDRHFSARRRHGRFRVSDDFSLQNDEQIEQQGGGVETQPVFVLRGCFFWVCAWNSWKSRSQWCWVGDWAESITRNIVDFFRLFGPNLTFRENCSITQSYTPWKINIEHNNGGLEDDFPFQRGGFCGYCIYMLIFRGVGGGLIVFSLLCVDIIQFDGRISFQNGLVQPPTSSGHRILQKKQGAATPTHPFNSEVRPY